MRPTSEPFAASCRFLLRSTGTLEWEIDNQAILLMEIQAHHIKRFLILIFTFYGSLLAALISVGQLIADRKSVKNWLFLGLFFVFGLFQIHYILFEMGLLMEYKAANVFPITAFYLLGPMVYLITTHSLHKNYSINPSGLLHFLPAVVASVISLSVIYTSEFQKPVLLSEYFYNTNMLYIGIAGWLFFVLYLVCSVRQLLNYFILSKQTILNHPSALVVCIILALLMLACISDIVAFISNKPVFMELSVLMLTLIIIFLFLINFRYPGYYKILYGVVEKEKNKRSYLKGINFKELTSKLNYLMDTEEIFTDEHISLPLLAQKVNVSQHQLSQFLNEKQGESFSSFINKYRIKKAKKMLVENPENKILAIAYDAGFQSKSTFNAAFAKYAGMTPHEFREKNVK
ncbi:MAG: helix-turn-helix domain-containing protein [Thermodesulfobacteriota bacterium]|nr:helix-turn-helix domain-containing protein [Thermodesulfobacteriota bacterium]